jgi:hypothetical protein
METESVGQCLLIQNKENKMKLIELKYKLDRTPQKPITFVKYFKTWKSLDKFVQSRKIKEYKVKGQSSTFKERIINYTSVLWEESERKII